MQFGIRRILGILVFALLFYGDSNGQLLDGFFSRQLGRNGVRTLRYMKLASKKVTLSGSASGGAFAMQLYLSHSRIFKGVAIFPGILYRCVEANKDSFSGILGCVHGLTNLTQVMNIAEELQKMGLIDPLKNLKHKRHYVEHGYNDEKFSFNNGRQIAQFFGEYSHNVRYHENNGIHGIATDNCGFSCGTRVYLNSGCLNCGYSAVHQGLSFIRKKKLYRTKSSTTESKIASCYQGSSVPGLYRINQAEFLQTNTFGIPTIPMERYGYMYIPPRCEANTSLCSLHIAVHDCSTMQIFGGIPWHITCAGYLEVAAANNLIMLFPQASISYTDPYSLLGCWDFVGYTGKLYGTKRGNQVDAVYRMIRRIMKKPPADFSYYDVPG